MVRALGITRDAEYREVAAGFDHVFDKNGESVVISRKIEWLKHKVALQAVE